MIIECMQYCTNRKRARAIHLIHTPPVDEIFLRRLRTLNFRRGYHLEISKRGQYFSKIPKGVNSIFVNFGYFLKGEKIWKQISRGLVRKPYKNSEGVAHN